MHQQAPLRLKKDEIEKLGAEAFVVLATDLHRTKVFKEKNLLLSTYEGPFSKEKSLVFATALSNSAGRASALYGVSRRSMRWGGWADNQPCWFVIDGEGKITYIFRPKFESPTSYVKDINLMLDALRKAADE